MYLEANCRTERVDPDEPSRRSSDRPASIATDLVKHFANTVTDQSAYGSVAAYQLGRNELRPYR